MHLAGVHVQIQLPFSFQKPFLQSHCSDTYNPVCVGGGKEGGGGVRACVCARVLYALTLENLYI